MSSPATVIAVLAILFGLYSLAKFAFFFVLPYPTRRAQLDKAYAGRAYATDRSDLVLLAVATVFGIATLVWGGEPVSFLAGLFVGATLIQLFFHRFHHPVAPDRAAPAPRSPLKEMSYAIQDRPGLAWPEMMALGALIAGSIARYLFG